MRRHGERRFVVEDAHWIHGPPATDRLDDLLVKVRHSPRLDSARLRPLAPGRFEVAIDRPDTGLARGSSP